MSLNYKALRPSLAGLAVFAALSTGGCDDTETDSVDALADAAPADAAVVPPPPDGGVADAPKSDGATLDTGSDLGTDLVIAAVEPDVDMVFVRFNTNGQIDNTFGTAGVATLNLSSRAGNVYDSPYGVDRDAQNRLVVFGRIKGENRTDADRVVVRLTKDGAVDTNFATKGVHTLNIGGVSDNARHGFVQADGKIFASGYAALPTLVGAQAANAIVLLRLNDDGTPDNTFGAAGVVTSNPFRNDVPNMPWGVVEAYSVGYQAGKYVTTGYGRATAAGTTVDVISARFDADGALDKTFGTKGVHIFDLAGQNDRGRNLSILPDGRVFVVGSASPAKDAVDTMVGVLSVDGAPDTTFNTTGFKVTDLGRSTDAFFGSAVSPDGKWALAAGYSGDTTGKDDGIVGLFPLTATGTAVVKAEPASATAHDRYLSAVFAPDGTFYTVGYVAESDTDTAIIVVHFKADGTKDLTFGTAGVAKLNVAVGKGVLETGNALVLQSDGKIVVAGTAEGK